MRMLDGGKARRWLAQHGVRDRHWQDEILGGFEPHPLYEQHLAPDDVLYQFIRNPALGDMSPARGSWFCLPGATQDALAIFGGGAGRRYQRFVVTMPAVALEGIAARKRRDWGIQIGGAGGATQLFIPPTQIARLTPVGAA